MGDAELVALQAGGNVGVGLGVHIRIDPNADRCALAQTGRHVVEHFEFGFAFDVEAANAQFERAAHLGAGLADPREDHPRRRDAGGQHAFEFATGDDVKAAAGPGKDLQDAQRGVGLHGIADLHLAAGKAALVRGQSRQHGGLGVDEQRRAVCAGQVGHAQVLDIQVSPAVADAGVAGQQWSGHGWAGAEEARAGAAGVGVGVPEPGNSLRRVWGRVAR